jgi:preprotein translocase subunit SecA
VKTAEQAEQEEAEKQKGTTTNTTTTSGNAKTSTSSTTGPDLRTNRDAPAPSTRPANEKIGRNDPCWCGSGKKFKKCHGR